MTRRGPGEVVAVAAAATAAAVVDTEVSVVDIGAARVMVAMIVRQCRSSNT
jgi:hypothetical protein